MVNPQIKTYIDQNKANFSMEELKQSLVKQGFTAMDVDEVIRVERGGQPQGPPPITPAGVQPAAGAAKPSFTKDPKLKQTIIIFVVAGVIFQLISYVISILGNNLMLSSFFSGFAIGAYGISIVWGAVSSGVGGLIFYFIYEPVRDWIKGIAFLSKFIHSLFTLFWIPSLVGFVISAVLTLIMFLLVGASPLATAFLATAGIASAGPTIASFFIGWVVLLGGNLAASYFYAKIVSKKLSSMYSW